MNVNDARDATMTSAEKKKRSVRFIWYCGLINEKIKKATESGEYSVQITYPPDHYVVRYHRLFSKIYEEHGYQVSFRPDYMYIKATKWILTIGWQDTPAVLK